MIGLKSPKRDNWNIIKLVEEGRPKMLARLRGVTDNHSEGAAA